MSLEQQEDSEARRMALGIDLVHVTDLRGVKKQQIPRDLLFLCPLKHANDFLQPSLRKHVHGNQWMPLMRRY